MGVVHLDDFSRELCHVWEKEENVKDLWEMRVNACRCDNFDQHF